MDQYILYDFFDRLRQSDGMELDMTQYFLFLELFLNGKVRTKAEVLNLCKTMWLTKKRHRLRFEQWFEEAWNAMDKKWSQDFLTQSRQTRPTDVTEDDKRTNTPAHQNVPHEHLPDQKKTKDTNGKIPSLPETKTEMADDLFNIVLNFDEESGQGIGQRKTDHQQLSEKATSFIFSDEKHLPIMPRRMGQALQKLRMTQQRIITDQLDLPKMMQEYGKNQSIDHFEYLDQQVNFQNVILLSDHEDSMIAFEEWGDFLYQSFKKHPTIGRVERYYFHDYPTSQNNQYGNQTFKLFDNVQHTSSTLLETILEKANVKSTWLVILSDAGVYDTQMNTTALTAWMEFFNRIEKNIGAITWFNPFPEKRWEGTMAAYLSLYVKMVPFNLKGLKQAINQVNHANRH